jgi:hypothetical protein
MAALASVAITSDENADVEPVRTAVATFVHALLPFAELVEKGNWHRPYGERTAIQVLRSA